MDQVPAAEQWAAFDQIEKTPEAKLAAAMTSGDPIAQYHVSIAIGNRGLLPSCIEAAALEKLLALEYGDLAAAAAWALIKVGHDRSLADAALIRVVKAGNWQERLNALNLIDYLGPQAEPLLSFVRETGKALRIRKKTDKAYTDTDRYAVEQCDITLAKRSAGHP